MGLPSLLNWEIICSCLISWFWNYKSHTVFILTKRDRKQIIIFERKVYRRILGPVYITAGPGSSVGIATGYGWVVRGSNPGGGARFSAPVQTVPGAHPASYTMGTGYFPRVKSGRDMTLTSHPLLVLWSWKSRAIPLLPIWAVQPVQSLSACTRVTFTFFFFTFFMTMKKKIGEY